MPKAILSWKKVWGVLSLILVGVGFWVQYRFNLFIDDDYLYSLFSGTDRLITSIPDALHSQAIEYMGHNGRFVIHTLVNLFCSVWGRDVFGVINTLFFLLFFAITFKLALNNTKHIFLKGALLLFVLWFFIPVPGVSILGNIAFSINYLWASAATFGFLLVYSNSKSEVGSKWEAGWMLLFGLFVGSLQESFSVGIAGSFVLYYLFHWKELRGQKKLLVLGYVLGTLIIVCAPGNFNRMEGEQSGVWDAGLKMLLLIKWSVFRDLFLGIPVLVMLLAYLAILYLRNKDHAVQYIKKNQVYLVAIVINMAFSLLIAYKGKWQMTSSAVMAIILLTHALFNAIDTHKKSMRTVLITVSAVLFLASYIPTLNIRKKIFYEHEALINSAKKTKDGIVWGSYENEGRTYFKQYRFFKSHFRLVFYMGDTYHKRILSSYLTKGKNPNLVTCVLPFSPETIDSFCTVENQLVRNESIYKAGVYPFFIIKTDNETNRIMNQKVLDNLLKAMHQLPLPDGLGVEDFPYKGYYYTIMYHR